MWHRPYVPTGLTQDRCIRAVQVKPAGKAKTLVHHANSTFEMLHEDGSFERMERVTEYAMGKIGEIVPEGVCRIALADSYIRWDIHLYPGGLGVTAPNAVVEDNVVELGIWLHPEGYEGEYKQDLQLYRLQEAAAGHPRPTGRRWSRATTPSTIRSASTAGSPTGICFCGPRLWRSSILRLVGPRW